MFTFTQARTNFSWTRKAMSSLGQQEALFRTHTHLMAGCSGRPEIKTEQTYKNFSDGEICLCVTSPYKEIYW